MIRTRIAKHLIRGLAFAGILFAIWAPASSALAQAQTTAPQARVVVDGDGSITAAPDSARIGCGVTTRANTAAAATEANTKGMTAVMTALANAGVAQQDIQTTQFSLQPVYASPTPNAAPKLTGFSVTNRLSVTVRPVGKVGDVLDRLIAAGANDIGDIEFAHSDLSILLDRARSAAIADARRKAEIYAKAADVTLGSVAWISEDGGNAPPPPLGGMMRAAVARAVPIASGEDTLHVHVTVGFDLVH